MQKAPVTHAPWREFTRPGKFPHQVAIKLVSAELLYVGPR
jgi:hypothetical protein